MATPCAALHRLVGTLGISVKAGIGSYIPATTPDSVHHRDHTDFSAGVGATRIQSRDRPARGDLWNFERSLQRAGNARILRGAGQGAGVNSRAVHRALSAPDRGDRVCVPAWAG